MTASPDFNLWLTQNAAPLFVDVAVKSVLLLALAWGAVFCMKGSSAAARHLVWFLAVAGLLALPLLSGSLPGWRVLPRWMDWTRAEPAPAVAAVAAADPARQASITPLPANIPGPVAIAPSFAAGWHESLSAATPSIRVPERTPGRAFDLWRVGLILWISVGALALLPVVLGTFGLWRLERTARVEKGSAWLELLKRLLNRLRIRRSVVLLKSAQRRMPMTWGVLRPRLLLPEESREWTEDRRRVVMLHELAHARRWDYLTNLTTQFACAMYWFNPLVWIAARQMIAERERACDDIVLHHGAKPAHYAEQVLEIAASAAPARFAAYSGLPMARPSNLEGRLRAILDGTRNRAALTRTALLLALGALIVILIPLSMAHAAGGRTSSPAAQEPTVQPSVSGEDLPAYAAALPRPLNRRQRARLEQIVRQFRAENDRVTPQAIDELVSMGAGVAFPMIRLLSRGKTDRPALKVLERLAPDPGVQRLLCEAIRNGSANTRHCGLIALGNSGNQQHVSFIANHVPEHPIAAGFALSRLGGPSAREHLLAAFDRVATTHWHVLATQVREMNDPGAIEPLKGILARVEWPPNDRFPPATARSAVEAIRALEALKGGPAPTYPAHLTLRGDYGGNFKYPFNGPLPKSFSVDGPASYIRLPKADPATSAGREAIFQAITSGSRPRSFTMDRDRLLAFNGIRISPLTVRTEPPHHYWTDAVAKIAQRDLVEFVEQYSLRHRPVPGPVAGIHSYPLPNESNLFAILSPDRRVTIANVRRTSEDYTYGVDFYDLDPLYQLVNVVGEPMVEDLLRLAGAADPGSNPNPAGNPQSNAAAATIPPSRSARESDLPGWLKLLYDPGAGGLIVSVDDDQNVTSIYAVDQADDAFLSNLRTLPSLRELDIQVTSGITPAGLARLAELPALEKLNLYHVNVDGAGLGDDVLRIASRMSTLRELGVAECGVTDEGARHLKGMTQLTALSLAGNRLTDEGMKSLAGLTNLQELNLSGSSSIHADMQITDDGLKRLSRLTGLTGLSVDRLPISGRTLAFPRLQSLALSGDRVDDSSLEGILQCRDLRQLTLQYTAISDNGLARLAALTELRHLNLDSHVITDAGIASLNILPKLEFLWLRASRLTDDALRHLSEVKTLTRLDLFGSGTPGATYGRLFTSAGLQELEALPGLRELHIYNLESQDGFAGLRSLSQLRTLVLQHTGIRAETIKRLQDALPETEVSVPRATAEFSPARLSDQTEPPALENRNPSN